MSHGTGGRRRRTVRLCLLALAGMLLATPAAPAGAATCDGVWVVVDASELGAGVQTRCAPGDPSSGLEALEAAGFSYTFVPRHPGMVCTIDGRPDPCNNAPSNAYWSYWHAPEGGDWQYSSTGAHERDPAPGTVDGWAFGAGEPPRTPPPADDPEPADDGADEGGDEGGRSDGGDDDPATPATDAESGGASSSGGSSSGSSSGGTSSGSGTSGGTSRSGDDDRAEVTSGPRGSGTTDDPTANEDPTRRDEPTDGATTEAATPTAREAGSATASPTPSAPPTEDTVALTEQDRADGLGGLLVGAVLAAGIAAAAVVRARGRARGEPPT